MNDQTQLDEQKKSFAALLNGGDYDYARPRRGEVHEAVILSIGENDAVVDLGAKRDGIVQPSDLDELDEAYRRSLEVGDHVPVAVTKYSSETDELVVSLKRGLEKQDWLRAQDLLDSGDIVEADVIDVNRGGVLVSYGNLRGFVPNSHLTSISRGLRGPKLKEAKEGLIGDTLSLVIIEVNQKRRRLVLSERLAKRRQRQRMLEELTEGEVRTGTVVNLVDFGAFVDLGGIDGLIHISELDWAHVNHPSEVLDVGDEVEVFVLSVDRERKRIGLSRKRLMPDPWDKVTQEIHPGDTVDGTVTNVVSFGFFVDIGDGVEGLVHVSEMPGGETALPEIPQGGTVTVRILEIDQWQRRIALRLEPNSIRAPEEEDEGEQEAQATEGAEEPVEVSAEEPTAETSEEASADQEPAAEEASADQEPAAEEAQVADAESEGAAEETDQQPESAVENDEDGEAEAQPVQEAAEEDESEDAVAEPAAA